MPQNIFDEFIQRFSPLHIYWIQFNGCIIKDDGTNACRKEVEKLLQQGKLPEEVEKLLNHAHMSLLLQWNFHTEITRERIEQMADLYYGVIQHRLKKEYPDKEFEIWQFDEDGDIVITFFQKRP